MPKKQELQEVMKVIKKLLMHVNRGSINKTRNANLCENAQIRRKSAKTG